MGYDEYSPTTRVIMWPMWLALALMSAVAIAALVVGSIALSNDDTVTPISSSDKFIATDPVTSSTVELTFGSEAKGMFAMTATSSVADTQQSWTCSEIDMNNRLFFCGQASGSNNAWLSYDGTELWWNMYNGVSGGSQTDGYPTQLKFKKK